MLPFSSLEFLLILFGYAIIVHLVVRYWNFLGFNILLFILNASYCIVFFPEPIQLFIFFLYEVAATVICIKYLKFKYKIWGVLILLLPLILIKLDIRFHFYPFELNSIIQFAGLSYISFRTVSYYLDNNNHEFKLNVLTYFNYLTFIPTLLIGPIDKYQSFSKSIDNIRNGLNLSSVENGIKMFFKGFVFKYILAELINRYWLYNYTTDLSTIASSFNIMYAYYFYLFFDFAGYSAMAIGLARIMGITVPLNFNNPFIAENISDFWKRFHITLGTWLKDYFFSPLYLFFTRKKYFGSSSLTRQNIALFLTFFLMGCWNGLKLNYILSGSLFGIYSVVHNTYSHYCKVHQRDVIFGSLNPTLVKIINIFIVFNLVSFSLYIFSGYCYFIN